MRLLVTGASSFLGAHFCRLASRRHEVFALYHRTPLQLNGVTSLRGDLQQRLTRERLAALDCDAVVHLACRVMGAQPGSAAERFNRAAMDAVMELELPVLYGSSTMVHWDRSSAYASGRIEDEARLASSGRPWASLRPCAPYGPRLLEHQPRHQESFHTLARWARWLPLVPLPGGGQALRQPVHVDDFSAAALRLLEQGLPSAAFDAGGPQAHSLAQLVEMMGEALSKQPRILPIPSALLARLASWSPHLDPELVKISDTDDTVDPRPLTEATQVQPRPFQEGVSDLWR